MRPFIFTSGMVIIPLHSLGHVHSPQMLVCIGITSSHYTSYDVGVAPYETLIEGTDPKCSLTRKWSHGFTLGTEVGHCSSCYHMKWSHGFTFSTEVYRPL